MIASTLPVQQEAFVRQAAFAEPLPGGRVRCHLCAFRCRIEPGRRGICGVRENRAGALHTLVYGRAVADEIDPIEKKPFHHFLPGSTAYSIATVGCNFRCLHCQNHAIALFPREHGGRLMGRALSPEEVVLLARRNGCGSVAYTYTEPTVFFEYAQRTAALAAAAGLRNVFVTNGTATPEALQALAPVLHGVNIDLKSFSDRFYRRICGGARLHWVLDAIGLHRRLGIWVEVTTLVIPGRNDSEAELRDIARFLVGVDRNIPWHVSRFFPAHRMAEVPPTPLATLERAREVGFEEGLRHVYLGNLRPGETGEDTVCPGCSVAVIRRRGHHVLANTLRDGACPHCGHAIAGVWR